MRPDPTPNLFPPLIISLCQNGINSGYVTNYEAGINHINSSVSFEMKKKNTIQKTFNTVKHITLYDESNSKNKKKKTWATRNRNIKSCLPSPSPRH